AATTCITEHAAEQIAQIFECESTGLLTPETTAGMSTEPTAEAASPAAASEGIGTHFGAAGVDLATVEARTLGRVANNVVGGIELLEPVFSLFVAGEQVGVRLFCSPAEGFLDLGVSGVAFNAQNGIGVFSHQWSACKTYTYRCG